LRDLDPVITHGRSIRLFCKDLFAAN
jgi:hypothetical protein